MPKLCRARACTETRKRVASREIQESMASSPAVGRKRGSTFADRKLVTDLDMWRTKTTTVGASGALGTQSISASILTPSRALLSFRSPPKSQLNAAEVQGRALCRVHAGTLPAIDGDQAGNLSLPPRGVTAPWLSDDVMNRSCRWSPTRPKERAGQVS